MKTACRIGICLGFLAATCSAGNRECRLLLECLGNQEKACRIQFKAADRMIRRGTGVQLLNSGRALDIPPKDILGLTAAFQRFYENGARRPSGSPLAQGNLGHLQDHFQFLKKNKAEIEALGIDVPSLELAVAAHDVGKAFLDQAILKYTQSKGKNAAPEKLDAFLRDYVLSHEHHSMAQIPRIVSTYLKEQGGTVETPEGKNRVVAYSLQIMEAIRTHNGVGAGEDLAHRYPSLSAKELEQVQSAWWPSNYRRFAEVMELKQQEYPTSSVPLSVVLNFMDRATLTASSAPQKLLSQQLGSQDFGSSLLQNALLSPAQGNMPLIAAQGDLLRGMAKTPEQSVAAERLVSEARAQTQKMIYLGNTLRQMQADALRQGIYPESKTIVFRRLDGTWIRIRGQDKAEGSLELWNPATEQFQAMIPVKQQSPVELLLSEIEQSDLWP